MKAPKAAFSGYSKLAPHWHYSKKIQTSFYQEILFLHTVCFLILARESFCQWSNRFVDFLDAKCDAQQALNLMHSMVLLLEGNMKKFYDHRLVSLTVEQALKFCVHNLVLVERSCGNRR